MNGLFSRLNASAEQPSSGDAPVPVPKPEPGRNTASRPSFERDIDILVVRPQPAGPSDNPPDRSSLIVLEADKAVEFVPRWPTGTLHRHDLVLGVVTRRMPQLGGVFVDVGSGHDGLLRLAPDEPSPSEGSRILTTVMREVQPGKGPVLTRQVSIPSRYAVLRPGQHPLRRSLLKQFDPETAQSLFLEDLAELERLFARLSGESQTGPAPRLILAAGDPLLMLARAWPHRIRSIQVEDAERYGTVERLIRDCAPDLMPCLRLHPAHRTHDLASVHRMSDIGLSVKARTIRLDCGGTLIFDRTEALHVIDVNSGQAQGSGKADLADTVNREAILEIARHLRLRNLTGMILVDLIHEKDPERQALYMALMRDALAGDRGKTTVYGFSSLLLLEMIRTAP